VDTVGEQPAASEADLTRLEQSLGRVVRSIKSKIIQRPGNVDGAGYALLTSLDRMDHIRLSDLANVLRLDPSTVSRQVHPLEAAGMIRREPDRDDRRACRLALTDAGREEIVRGRRVRHSVLEHAVASWSAADRDQLVTLLERLALDLETHPGKAARAPDE
jgi:DNA-binding MarR family transcriptional regulator